MAEGLQYKENLTLISGGYPGEGTGSNGLVQNWTETTGDSGSSTVTYYYHDSATMTDANSTYVEINITDNWTATKDNRNYYHITVSTVINYIRRTKVGSPSPLSVYMFARRNASSANIWTSGGCVDAANSGTNATNINMGTTTFDLAPGQSTVAHGTVYFRSNICGHNNAQPPSIYVDEFWLGVNFRNTLPPDYRPGKTWNGNEWLSHNRESGNYVSSKNKFNTQSYYNAISSDKTQATVSLSNNAITWSNNTNDSYFPAIYNYSGFSSHQSSAIAVEPNTPYVFSCKITGTIGSGRIYIYEGDASYNGINVNHEVVTSGVDQPHIYFVTTANTKYIIVRFARWDSTTSTVTLSELQLAKKTGKNILDPFKLQALPSRLQGGVTLTRTGEGTFTISGTGTQSGIFGSNWVDYTHAESVALLSGPGTYVLSTTATGAFYPALGVELRQNSSTVASGWVQNTGGKTVSITQTMIDDPTFNLRFSFYGGSGQTIKPATFNVQFEKGSTPTAYEQFTPAYEPWATTHFSPGASDIYTSSSAKRTMRTKDGGVGTDDAPFIKHSDAWKNQREIGLQ